MPPTVLEPGDRDRLETALERFAPDVTERANGTLVATFGGTAHFAVEPDGTVDAGMPLHDFDGPAQRLTFDHDEGTIEVSFTAGDDAVVYTFRRP
jgi:hypothetical protein